MITTLGEEEAADLKVKEECEADRMEDTRKSAVTSRTMDELSDEISTLESEIEELKVQIEEKEKAIKKIEEELEEAKRIREDEKAAWEVSDKEDTEAVETVAAATEVLEKFYAGLQLQKHSKKDVPLAEQIKAGGAPPPPPPTWTEGSEVTSTESGTGIIAILTLLKEDIEKDQAKAKAAEEEAQAAYDKFKEEGEAEIASLQEAITELEGQVSEKETTIEEKTEERLTAKGELEAILEKIKAAEPGCNFATVNFAKRVANRQIEVDGLKKAKAILEGADFSGGGERPA